MGEYVFGYDSKGRRLAIRKDEKPEDTILKCLHCKRLSKISGESSGKIVSVLENSHSYTLLPAFLDKLVDCCDDPLIVEAGLIDESGVKSGECKAAEIPDSKVDDLVLSFSLCGRSIFSNIPDDDNRTIAGWAAPSYVNTPQNKPISILPKSLPYIK